MIGNFELYEFVDKQKLQTLINSGLLNERWTDEDRKKKHKAYVINKYEGEFQEITDYYNNLNDNGLIKINYVKNKLQGRRLLPNCLSSKRRIYRNYLLCDDYYDFDMVNSCASILLYLGIKHKLQDIASLRRYVNNRKSWFKDIKEWFKCDDKKAKDIMTSTTFGAKINFQGGTALSAYKNSLSTIQTQLQNIDAYNFIQTEKPDGLSWMAILIQTIEANIVVGLLTHIINNYPQLVSFKQLRDVIVATYELDGFKLLKENVDNFGGPNAVIGIINEWLNENSYNEILFINKSMEEKINFDDEIITYSQNPPSREQSPTCITQTFSPIIIEPQPQPQAEPEIKLTILTLEDLEKGERYIADLIYPMFQKTIKYYEKTQGTKTLKYWFELNDRNLWVISTDAPKKKIITKLQELIEIEKIRVWNLWKVETDARKKYELANDEETIRKHYKGVGKASYSNTLCKDYLAYNLQDNLFINKLNKTTGKFVFNDGLYDLKTRQFQSGFKYDDYITTDELLPYNYQSLNSNMEKTNYLKSEFKKIYNNDETHLEYALSVIGYSLTGDASLEKAIYYIIDGTEEKKGDNGKTLIFNLLCLIFKGLVVSSDSMFIEDGYSKVHKHLINFKNARLVYLDEGTQKKVNAKLLKKIGDGTSIEVEIMFGTTEDIDIKFKLFVCSNHLPKIKKDEEAVFNRYIQIQCNSHFDRTGTRTQENPEKLEFIADTHLSKKLLDGYKDEMMLLFLDYACKYYERGLPEIPTQFVEAKNITKIQNNEFAKWFFENYEASSKTNENGELTDRISLDELINECILNIDGTEIKKELKKLNVIYDKDLRGLGTKLGKEGKKVYIKGGFLGWTKKKVEKEEEVVEGKEEKKE